MFLRAPLSLLCDLCVMFSFFSENYLIITIFFVAVNPSVCMW